MNPIVRILAFTGAGMVIGLAFVVFVITVCASTVALHGEEKTVAIGYAGLALFGGPVIGGLVGLIGAVWDYFRQN